MCADRHKEKAVTAGQELVNEVVEKGKSLGGTADWRWFQVPFDTVRLASARWEGSILESV